MSQDNRKEINNIVQQLQLLSIQQADLIKRLDILTKEDSQAPKKLPAGNKPTAEIQPIPLSKELAIGDRVRINNPRYLQPDSGKVIKLTQNRVTVQAANGTKIVRAAKNLTIE